MSKNFEITYESEIDGTPDQVFFAVTEGAAGWLFDLPGEIEPRVGGSGPAGSTVTAWEPARHYGNHMEGPGGFFNDLDFQITEQSNGKSWLRYVHSGIIFEDWDNQYDAATKHTAFYQHTLGQYVKYFAGRRAAWADVQGPESSSAADAFEVLKDALGVARTDSNGASAAEVGDAVQLVIPGIGDISAEVDYLSEHFVGLRSENAMYRFFGRNAFGSVVGMVIHDFTPGTDVVVQSAAWKAWLDGLYS